MSKKLKSGVWFKRLGKTAAKAGEPPSLHFGGISSRLTAQPRNILMWFYDKAPLHYMHQRYAMGICLRQGCTIGIDTNAFVLGPDEGIIVFPFQAHHFVFPKQGKFLNLAVTFALENTSDRSLEPLRNSVFTVSGKDVDILEEMLALGRSDTARSKSEVAHLLSRFLCRKLDEQALAQEITPRKNLVESKYDRIIRYIREHVSEPITIQDIAAAENISIPHLSRVFKEHTAGLNVGRFIMSLRIKRAYEMLMHSELNVAEIAGKCGFSDPFVFSRAFKRMAGLSPANYRKHFQRPSSRG